MQQTYKLRKFTPDDLQSVMHINRLCLPDVPVGACLMQHKQTVFNEKT